MSDTSSEKLVRQTIKLITKNFNLDYENVKKSSKKIVKMAKIFDEKMLGMMEELLDLARINSEEELVDFDVEVLMMYCRIKDLEPDVDSEKGLRKAVWANFEEEYGDSDSEEDSEPESDLESESEPEPPEKPVKSKKVKKLVQVIE